MMLFKIDTGGLILLLIGLIIRFIVGRRRFKRRNFAGTQLFSSYLASQLIPLLERVFNLIALFLIFSGLITMLI